MDFDGIWKRLINTKYGKRLMVGDPGRPKGLMEWVYGRKF